MNPGGAGGVTIGVVDSLQDREGIGRVRLRFPYLADQPSADARIAAPFAGKQRGFFWKPEVGDEVLVAFELGDMQRPYVLGGLWSTADEPPPDDGRPEDNNWRFVRSRSGHILRFDDTAGGEKIEIVDKDGKRRIVIDASSSRIQIVCDQGDVEVTAPQGKVQVQGQTIEVKSSGELTLEASGNLTIRGATVKIN